ncbi:MAG TPA: FAD-dependent oxidoreductase, partial [Rhizobacter sp.]|nr:FAD-dependent oxidoreductase [Rhizobacter sp.]
MRVVVMGAGIIGVSTAWYLLEQGHEVTVVDRQRDAALETSFANGAQISVSFCEPWAHPAAPLKVAKWLLRDDAPLLFRPKLDPHQWRWGLSFLTQCTHAAFERNVTQLVALGRYSHESLKSLVAQTGIEYDRLERGILHFFSNQQDFDDAATGVELMRRHGVDRRLLSRDEVLQVEPALRGFGERIAGGTYTASDESGDARVFTQQLARLCQQRGASFLYEHDILGLQKSGDGIEAVQVADMRSGERKWLKADAFVAAMGSYTPAL